jgi:hypothetical protein
MDEKKYRIDAFSGLSFIDKRDKGWLYYLYSTDENEASNSTPDADRKRYPVNPNLILPIQWWGMI